MGKNLKCEVLIIGAGPAGASLAFYLAGKGIESILIDKKQRIDTPLRCAEYVPAPIVRLFGGPISGINCSTVSMDTYIDYKYANTIPSPGFMLDRPVFLRTLVDSFIKQGGKFMPGTKAVSFDEGYGGTFKSGHAKISIRNRDQQNNESIGKDIQQKESRGIGFKKEGLRRKDFRDNDPGMVSTVIQGRYEKRSIIRSKIVVGADGPNSIVGKYIGSINSGYILGLGEKIPVEAKDKNKTLIFFSPKIEGGYGWLFPKEGSTNIGIGCQFAVNKKNINITLKNIYKDFKNEIFSMDFLDQKGGRSDTDEKIDAGEPIEQPDMIPRSQNSGLMTGLIPASGMLKKTVSGSFILAGDAAGLTNPITGTGIYNAVNSSKIISSVISKALKNSEMDLLSDIEKQYLDTFGRSLQRAISRRVELMDSWPGGNGPDAYSKSDFNVLIRKCWISFKDYWRP